jgi:hypothetical protein
VSYDWKPQLLLGVSVPGSIGAFLGPHLSPSEHPSYSGSSCSFLPSSLFDRRFFITASFAPCHFRTAGRPYSGGGELLSPSTFFEGRNFPDEVSFPPCHFCTAGHLPAGGNQLPPRFTISLGHFPQFLAAPREHISDLTPIPRSSDRHC